MIYFNITLTLTVLARLFEVRSQKQCPLCTISNSLSNWRERTWCILYKKTLEMRSVRNSYCSRGLAFDITNSVSTLNTYLEKTLSYDLLLLCLCLFYTSHIITYILVICMLETLQPIFE